MYGVSKTLFLFCCLTLISANNSNNKNNNYDDPSELLFICTSGETIARDQECDGIVHCQDLSDETKACLRLQCPPYVYRCSYGACIDPDLTCDGKNDCKDGSDELLCDETLRNKTCGFYEFRCNSGQCIDGSLKCDGVYHCGDKSDEIKSVCWNTKCPDYTFRCNYGACVDGTAPCDGITDCVDQSDENLIACRNKLDTCIVSEEYGNSSFATGTIVEPGTTITMQCDKSSKNMSNIIIAVCKQGSWTYPLGNCTTRLPSIMINIFLNITINNQSKIEGTTTEDDLDRVVFLS